MSIIIKSIKNGEKLFRSTKPFEIKYDVNAIGYDDLISMGKRALIREHYDSWHNPHRDIFEKEPRLEEYSLKKLINEINAPKYFVNDKTILNLPIANIRKIHNIKRRACNSYRGASLIDSPDWVLKKIKDEGIKTIIDVDGYRNYYKERINKAGMNFVSFSMDKYWNNIYLDKSSRYFIEPFKKFIKAIKDDYFYIGCMMGTNKTDNAMMLANAFNTNMKTKGYQHAKYWGTAYDEQVLEVYKGLSAKDKQELEIDKAFEKELYKKYSNSH